MQHFRPLPPLSISSSLSYSCHAGPKCMTVIGAINFCRTFFVRNLLLGIFRAENELRTLVSRSIKERSITWYLRQKNSRYCFCMASWTNLRRSSQKSLTATILTNSCPFYVISKNFRSSPPKKWNQSSQRRDYDRNLAQSFFDKCIPKVE